MAAALASNQVWGIGDVTRFCREQGIRRQTFYQWKRRFDQEGLDGLRERTRRPNSIPNATCGQIEDAVVRAPVAANC